MPMYEGDEFDRGDIPSHFKKDLVDAIMVAASTGWKIHLTTRKGLTCISWAEHEDGTPRAKHHFGLNSRSNNANLNKFRRDIIKYGDPLKVSILDAAAKGEVPLEQVGNQFASIADPGVVVHAEPETEEVVTDNQPTVVSEKPLLAKSSEGVGYDSETTIERRWSDGSVDYRCTLCEFASPHRLSPSRHYGTAHSKGRNPMPPRFKAEIPGAATYSPRQARVDALARVIAEMIEAGETDAHVLARAALTWVHEQSRDKTDLAAEVEEMTAEDMLDRIRHMLFREEYGAQRAALDKANLEIEQLRIKTDAAVEEARRQHDLTDKMREQLTEFLDLGRTLTMEEVEARVG